jgi:hypothetical protein
VVLFSKMEKSQTNYTWLGAVWEHKAGVLFWHVKPEMPFNCQVDSHI